MDATRSVCSIENFFLQQVTKGRSCGHSVVRGMYNGDLQKGPKNLASNYRPVSITSVMQDDGVHHDNTVVHMSDNNLFANEQHGFVPRRECMTNLLSAMEDGSEAIELGLDTDVIYTDFAKAFDSVPHKRLSLKLKANGIEGDVLKWIRSFLTGRRHRVRVDGELSD